VSLPVSIDGFDFPNVPALAILKKVMVATNVQRSMLLPLIPAEAVILA
jgi:hypothetical protein